MRYESIFQQLVYVQVFKVTVTKAYRTFHFACFCLTVSLSLSDGQRQLIFSTCESIELFSDLT